MDGIFALDALGIPILPIIFSPLNPRKRKTYKRRPNPFSMRDEDFKSKYRFSKRYIKKVTDLIKDDIAKDSRGASISPELQVLIAIRAWARNEVQDDSGVLHGTSQSSVSIICKRVGLALVRRARDFIKMPRNTTERDEATKRFEKICGFKGAIGAIDCTHIRIKKVTGDDAHRYLNKNGYYSLNCQVVCDANLRIRDIVARWQGSARDSRIFSESGLKRRFEAGEFDGRLLLGDSDYQCTDYLFTPVLDPQGSKEEAYNVAHTTTRNIIERCFGVWKRRFRILSKGFNTSLKNTKIVITALAVLHNIALDTREELVESDNVRNAVDPHDVPVGPPPTKAGNAARTLFIDTHF